MKYLAYFQAFQTSLPEEHLESSFAGSDSAAGCPVMSVGILGAYMSYQTVHLLDHRIQNSASHFPDVP